MESSRQRGRCAEPFQRQKKGSWEPLKIPLSSLPAMGLLNSIWKCLTFLTLLHLHAWLLMVSAVPLTHTCYCAITVHGFISIVFRPAMCAPLQKHMSAFNARLKNAQGIDQPGSRTSCCKNMRL